MLCQKCFLLTDEMWAWKSLSLGNPLGNLHTSCHWCVLLPAWTQRSWLWFYSVASAALYDQSFAPIGFESSYCCTSGYLKPDEGLWAADLSSGFWSFCSQGAPHPSSVCPALQLLLTSLRDDSLCQCRRSLLHRNTALNLLNIFAVIYAPLLTAEKLFIDWTRYVKGKSCTGITHHNEGPGYNVLATFMWGLFTHTVTVLLELELNYHK